MLPRPFINEGPEEMIEVYAQNFDDTWFSIALNQQQIVASSFGADQPTTIKNVLSNISFNHPFQVFHEPTTFAKNALATLKSIYDGKNAPLKLGFGNKPFATLYQKSIKNNFDHPAWLRNFLRCNR